MARRHVPHRLSLANGFDGVPPGGRPALQGAPPPNGLTPKFNAAAKRKKLTPKRKSTVSVQQIKALEKKLSRPAHTLEMTNFGNINGSYDPKRDQKIRETIKAIQCALKKQQIKTRRAFAKAQLNNKAKHSFNRSSGMGM